MSKNKKRVLPTWMVNADATSKHANVSREQNAAKSAISSHVCEETSHLEFHGKIHYIFIKDECNFACQSIIESSHSPIICGFDIEWKVTYGAGKGPRKAAVFQICTSENKCFVFHVSAMTGLPVALKRVIEDEQVIKAGVGIVGDMSKISLDFNINPAGIADLSVMLNKAKKISENWSLNGMTLHMLNKKLRKNSRIRCSDWEKYPLTDEQLQYAALDAYDFKSLGEEKRFIETLEKGTNGENIETVKQKDKL